MFSKRLVSTLAAAVVALGLGAGTASAQTSDTATITYEVTAITQINLNGSASLQIVAGTPGGGLPSVTSTGVTYDITNNAGTGATKLIGSINSAMPTATTLLVNVVAPSGATSAGFVALTTTDQDLVTAIGNVNEAGVGMTFRLDATVAAGVVASAQKTFTMTVVVG